MVIIVCVDDRSGMAFNNRRQSRDSKVYEDILSFAALEKIEMDDRSRPLFENIKATEAPAQNSSEKYCFLEFESPSDIKNIESIIIYRWNRTYPADTHFDIDLNDYILTDTKEFAGSSHEKITKETYSREK